MRIGIIGVGQMGRSYARHLRALGVEPRELLLYDTVTDRSMQAATEFSGTPVSEFPEGLDAAIVAVSTPAHARVVGKLARAGVPHILCEKPLGLTTTDVGAMRAQIGSARVYTALVINFSGAFAQLRGLMGSTPGARSLLEAFAQWGKPRPLDKNARPSSGDVEDESVHPIAFVMGLAGFRSVEHATVLGSVGMLSFVDPVVQRAARKRDVSFPMRPSSSTAAMITLSLTGKAELVSLSVQSSFLLAKQVRMVHGVLGDLSEPSILFCVEFDKPGAHSVCDELTLTELQARHTTTQTFCGDKLHEMTKAFLETAAGAPPDARLASFDDGADLVRITEAILHSSKRGMAQRVIF